MVSRPSDPAFIGLGFCVLDPVVPADPADAAFAFDAGACTAATDMTRGVRQFFVELHGEREVSTSTSETPVIGLDHIVVIYAENRSFDNLYGLFPGANGIPWGQDGPRPCLPTTKKTACVRPYHDPDDVNGGGPIKTDMAFKILKAFREAGIDMPNPQYDVHLRDLDPVRAGWHRSRDG